MIKLTYLINRDVKEERTYLYRRDSSISIRLNIRQQKNRLIIYSVLLHWLQRSQFILLVNTDGENFRYKKAVDNIRLRTTSKNYIVRSFFTKFMKSSQLITTDCLDAFRWM